VQELSVYRDRLERPVGRVENGPSRGLVDAAGLHPHVPVLHQIDPADPVLRPDSVQPFEERHGAEAPAVDRDGVARLELDLNVRRHVGRLLGRAGQQEHLLGGLGPGVFEDAALVGDVEEIPVHRVGPRGGCRHRDPMTLGVGHEVGAGPQVPVPPGSDDPKVGGEGRVGELEAHLVVALPGRAVGDGVRPLGAGHGHLPLGDEGSRE
jgi:hypothetical protein